MISHWGIERLALFWVLAWLFLITTAFVEVAVAHLMFDENPIEFAIKYHHSSLSDYSKAVGTILLVFMGLISIVATVMIARPYCVGDTVPWPMLKKIYSCPVLNPIACCYVYEKHIKKEAMPRRKDAAYTRLAALFFRLWIALSAVFVVSCAHANEHMCFLLLSLHGWIAWIYVYKAREYKDARQRSRLCYALMLFWVSFVIIPFDYVNRNKA